MLLKSHSQNELTHTKSLQYVITLYNRFSAFLPEAINEVSFTSNFPFFSIKPQQKIQLHPKSD